MGLKTEKNDIIKLCDNLEGKVNINDKIDYITLYLVSYINGNRKAFVNIKAQYMSIANETDILAGSSLLISVTSALICLCSLFEKSLFYAIMCSVVFIIEIGLIWYLMNVNKKTKKWKYSIGLILDEIDNRWEDYFPNKPKIIIVNNKAYDEMLKHFKRSKLGVR